jgi:hypothetical protein
MMFRSVKKQDKWLEGENLVMENGWRMWNEYESDSQGSAFIEHLF